ncbi:hypothetical protein D3C81_1776000 [compost metagenome]
MNLLTLKHMQPQQGRQAANRGDFRPQVTADDIRIDHRLLGHPSGLAGIDRQRPDQHRGHVVHDRGQQRRQQPRAHGRAPDAMLGEPVEQARQGVCQPRVAQAVDHQVHAQGENHDMPGCFLEHLARGDLVATPGNHQQHRRTNGGNGTDRNSQGFQGEAPEQ